jgi:hypothetical protein
MVHIDHFNGFRFEVSRRSKQICMWYTLSFRHSSIHFQRQSYYYSHPLTSQLGTVTCNAWTSLMSLSTLSKSTATRSTRFYTQHKNGAWSCPIASSESATAHVSIHPSQKLPSLSILFNSLRTRLADALSCYSSRTVASCSCCLHPPDGFGKSMSPRHVGTVVPPTTSV